MSPSGRPRVAILIPCYNEEVTVARVVAQFRAELPGADIYVYDNNSTDRTAEEALGAGAVVRHERRQGKGFVVQSMFRDVDADLYVMVDGDDTYPAEAVHQLLAPVREGRADMSVGSRLHAESQSEFRHLNRWGNRLVLAVLNAVFRARLTDILSGYRAFSRRFVKGVPLFGGGFEIETELTIKTVARGYRVVEVPVGLTHRPEGSHSKIRFVRDGLLILNTILALFRDYKPLTFFGGAGAVLVLSALAPGLYAALGLSDAEPFARTLAAVLFVGLVLCGLLSITAGLILHSIARRAQEFEYQLSVLSDELRTGRRADERAGGAREGHAPDAPDALDAGRAGRDAGLSRAGR
jgi:glycosyltransferase involved in cell wall biosynthesis